MDLQFIFMGVPEVLRTLFNPIMAIFLLALASGWARTKILWLVFALAMLTALSHGAVNDIIYSPPWTLAFFEVLLILVAIIPIWGLTLSVKSEALALAIIAYFLFLGSNIFLSNVIGVVLFILISIIFIRGTYFTLKTWITTPDGK